MIDNNLYFRWFAKQWRDMQEKFKGFDCSHIKITCAPEGRRNVLKRQTY